MFCDKIFSVDHIFSDICKMASAHKLTFIINKRVLNTINIIMKYSKGVETTIRHTLYLKVFRFLGI